MLRVRTLDGLAKTDSLRQQARLAPRARRTKIELAACNTLANPAGAACLFERGLVCGLYGRTAPARKTAVHLTFDLLVSNRLRDTL